MNHLGVNSRLMNKIFAAVAALAVAVSLAGCSAAPKDLSTTKALVSAYVDAGGDCPSPTDVDVSAMAAGDASLKDMSGVSCPGDVGLFVFKSKASRDKFLDLIDQVATLSKTAINVAMGDTWIVAGTKLDNEKFASALGGTARK